MPPPNSWWVKPLDGRADQYALAATAYHLLTGAPLFPNSNAAVVIGQHLSAQPPSLAGSHPELAALDSVLGKALAKDPKYRFGSCTEFARALGNATAMPLPRPAYVPDADISDLAHPGGAAAPMRWPTLLAAVALVVAVCVVAVCRHQRHQPITSGVTEVRAHRNRASQQQQRDHLGAAVRSIAVQAPRNSATSHRVRR